MDATVPDTSTGTAVETPSSPALETPSAPTSAPDLGAMSPDERSHWRLTGEFPSAKDSSEAASTPAEPAEQAASTDASSTPASEPGTPKKNAATRIQQLLEENKLLKERLESAPRESRPAPAVDERAASSPAQAAERTLDAAIASPDLSRPPLEEGDFFREFPDASMAAFVDYRHGYREAMSEARRAADQQRESLSSSYAQRMAPAIEADPQFWSTLDPRLKETTPIALLPAGEAPTALNFAAQEILESEHPAEIMSYLSAHPQYLEVLSRMSSAHAIRAIARLDALVGSVSSVPTKQPVGKTTTSAPAVPQTLGSKPAESADETTTSVVAGDFRRYKSAMNRREGA